MTSVRPRTSDAGGTRKRPPWRLPQQLTGGPTLALLVLPVAGSFLVSSSRMLSVLVFGAIAALMAYSLHILYHYSGLLSLAHGALWGVGAYAAALTARHWDFGFWPSLLFSALVGGAAAALLAVPSLRMRGVSFLIFTFACGELIRFLLVENDALTGGVNGLVVVPESPKVLGLELDSLRERFFLTMGLVYLVIAIHWAVGRTTMGRRLTAIREDEELAQAVGVPTRLMCALMFTLSGALAGIAGAAYQLQQSALTPGLFGMYLLMSVLLAIILAGSAWLVGPLLAAFGLGIAPEFIGLSPEDAQLLYGVLLILAVLVTVALADALPRSPAGSVPEAHSADVAEGDAPNSRLSQDRSQADWPASPPRRGASAARPIVELHGVSKSFGSVTALNGVSLDIHPGEVLGVIGPNGSGKTTLLSCISGSLRPDAGQVHLHGQDVTAWPLHKRARRGLVRTFQRPAIFPQLDVSTGVRIALESRGRSSQYSDASLHALLGAVALSRFALTPAGDLPYGAAKRLGVAMALALEPDVLLMDEPAAGLNDAETRQLAQLVGSLAASGMTVAIVDHDVPFMLSICDRLVALDSGEVVTSGLPDDVVGDPRVVAGYLGEDYAARWVAR